MDVEVFVDNMHVVTAKAYIWCVLGFMTLFMLAVKLVTNCGVRNLCAVALVVDSVLKMCCYCFGCSTVYIFTAASTKEVETVISFDVPADERVLPFTQLSFKALVTVVHCESPALFFTQDDDQWRASNRLTRELHKIMQQDDAPGQEVGVCFRNRNVNDSFIRLDQKTCSAKYI